MQLEFTIEMQLTALEETVAKGRDYFPLLLGMWMGEQAKEGNLHALTGEFHQFRYLDQTSLNVFDHLHDAWASKQDSVTPVILDQEPHALSVTMTCMEGGLVKTVVELFRNP